MSKFTVNKSKDYTVLSNHHLRDKNLSLKAKGLLTVMLSLPDDWDYSINGLVAICLEGKGSITSTIKELEKNNYLIRTLEKDNLGKFVGYNYDVYEKPFTDKPSTNNPFTENPSTDNQPQLNTKQSITKQLNTKEINTNNDLLSLEESEFENLWKTYKKKSNKANSLKAYLKARKGYKSSNISYKPVSYEEIEQGLKRYNSFLERNNTERRFTKDFSTWLNGRCWEDDYEENELTREQGGYAF